MKAEFGKDGTIWLRAESHMEAFALNRWSDDNMIDDGDTYAISTSKLIIVGCFEEEDDENAG